MPMTPGGSQIHCAATSFAAGLILVGFCAALAVADQPPLSGPARIIDGDTIAIGEQRVRLWGIDAPEASQRCSDRAGSPYACGRAAGAYLEGLAAYRAVACSERDRDRYGRIVAVCTVGGRDLGSAMVSAGWAIDYRRYSGGAYAGEQREAEAGGRGMWAGWFDLPENHRRAGR